MGPILTFLNVDLTNRVGYSDQDHPDGFGSLARKLLSVSGIVGVLKASPRKQANDERKLSFWHSDFLKLFV